MTPAQITATFTALDRFEVFDRFRRYPITDDVLAEMGAFATAQLRELWEDVEDAWFHNELGEPPEASSVQVVATHVGNGEVSLGLSLG